MPDSDDVIQQLRTVRDFIRWGASRMNEAGIHFGHGTMDAIDEAAALVLHALHLPPDLHVEYLRANLTANEKRAVIALLERRVRERKPAAYLTNRAWFMGLPFYVDERVLVPRSPMAELIDQRFMPWLDPDTVHTILDLGTGSACIGIACAYAFPEARVDLADISSDALEVAERNVLEHGLENRIEIIQSDLFTGLRERRYDLIISNPPYVSQEEMGRLPAEYHHEPAMGLEAGPQGLDVVLAILRQARDYLSETGRLVVEVGNAQYALVDTFPEAPFLWLDFEQGGDGVFLITAAQLQGCRAMFVSQP